jgi:hypothetical protein
MLLVIKVVFVGGQGGLFPLWSGENQFFLYFSSLFLKCFHNFHTNLPTGFYHKYHPGCTVFDVARQNLVRFLIVSSISVPISYLITNLYFVLLVRLFRNFKPILNYWSALWTIFDHPTDSTQDFCQIKISLSLVNL